MARRLATLLLSSLALACSSDAAGPQQPSDDDGWGGRREPGGADPDQHPSGHADTTSGEALTYWKDMLPIFEAHCTGCHREGGSGPFRLDDYAAAKAHAGAIVGATRARTMPPSFIRADGSCGDFADVNQLSDDQVARIDRWAGSGAQEGTPREVELPKLARLAAPREYVTPAYVPHAIGGSIASTDDYRCFVFDAGIDTEQFITGYDVAPGAGSVHHVIGYLVDPEAPSLVPGVRNAEAMLLEDLRSPDVPGWSCLSNVGETVAPKDLRATWSPGQGATMLPNQSGVRIRPTDKVVVQVHFSVKPTAGGHDPSGGVAHQALRAQAPDPTALGIVTALELDLAREVKNEGFFLTGDGLLDSLATPLPIALTPGRKSQIVRWTHTLRELHLTRPRAELWGIYPHMHALGARYAATLFALGSGEECIAEVPRWNYHWQAMYAYAKPIEVTPDTRVNVTCEYDTRARTEPVLPGMGTENEMCAAFLYLTAPSR